MKTKLLIISAILFCSNNFFAQKTKKIIIGTVIDSLGIVINANIINLNTSQGTFSSDKGLFRIFVTKGDTLSVSSVQHLKKKILITEALIEQKNIKIKLKSNIYQLDEFELRRHNLKGSLSLDIDQVPRDKKDSILRNVMDLSKVDMKANLPDDYIDKRVRPQINETDPTRAFAGVGAAAIIPFKYSQRLWALRKKLAQKKAFPYKILSELGDQFFFDELKIPIDNYFHFLEYCNTFSIEDLHKEGKILDVIKILRRESVSYLKIIKKE